MNSTQNLGCVSMFPSSVSNQNDYSNDIEEQTFPNDGVLTQVSFNVQTRSVGDFEIDDVDDCNPTPSSNVEETINDEDSADVEAQDEVIETVDGSKLWIPNVPVQFKPKVNDVFSSYQEAESFYRTYSDFAGFDVRLNAKKTNKDGIIQTRWFVCSKEGIPKKKFFDSLELGPGDRRYRNSNVKRSGCNACIKIHLLKDKSQYEVYAFVEAHNHALFNNNDRRFSRKNRKMQYTDYRNVLNSSSYKLGATRAHRIQTALKGGFDHNRCSVVEYKNFKRDVGLFVGNKDAKMLINKLSNRKDIKSEYFFEYKCDERELHAIFWADEVAQLNYREFGDVISFDATYRTNEHAMSFVPFLAVDNHKSSVVVGSALIAGETIENYKWVLRAFLKCYDRQPLVVITDQCSAMKQAVPYVFTESRHRLCMWHIMKKVPAKISAALNVNPNFKRAINKLVWNFHISPEDFEIQWNSMIQEYDLADEDWFRDMYAIRHDWIPAFYKDTPMSGLMRTTSRSESANSFFNIYLEFHYDLVKFHINYDNAIEKQRDTQSSKENVTRNTFPQLISSYPIESHAARLYTRNFFRDFQKEIKKAMLRCGIENVEVLSDTKNYVISHKNKLSETKILYKVSRRVSTNSADCECKFFIRNGFLCRHALKVLITEPVDSIPDQYVMRRWTRELVPVQLQSARVRYGESDPEKEKLLTGVYSTIDDIVSIVRNDKPLLLKLNEVLGNFKNEARSQLPFEHPSQQKNDAITEYYGVSVPNDVDILPPSGLRNKGCGTGKRLISTSERIQSKSKRPKRKCKKCGQSNGHDSRNCPSVAPS